MAQPYPDEPTWWAAYEADVAAVYARAGLPFPDNAAAFRWFSRCAYDIGAGLAPDAARAKHLRGLEEALGLVTPPPAEPGERLTPPIVGYVRTEGRRWADDSGPRSFRICSWFPALRCYRDHRDAALRQLDDIARYWQGVRIFWHLGTDYWTSAAKNVDPRWPDFDGLFTDFLRQCAARDLRVSLTAGDMQVICPQGSASPDERRLYQRIAELAASVDPLTVSWFGIANESWQNMADGKNPVYLAELSSIVQRAYPWGAHALSDPFDNEEPAALDAYARAPANCTLVHGTRDFPDSFRRAFNVSYEGHGWLVNQDEPVGAGPDVYKRDDDPRHLFGLYTLHRIAGQMTTFFGGHGIKAWTPDAGLERDWGFRELPTLWRDMAMSEDLAAWTLVPGHLGEAAIYPSRFADRGQGPARCDGAQTGDRAWFVVSGGSGTWEIRSRWDADVRIWHHGGVVREGRASADEVVFTVAADAARALVVESQRR